MRISVDSNLTPQRLQTKPPSPIVQHCLSTPHVDRIGQEAPSVHRRSSEAEDIHQTNSSLLSESRLSSKASIQTPDKSRLPDNFMNTNDTINRNRPMNIEVDKVPSKNIPEVVIDFRSDQNVMPTSVSRNDDSTAAEDELSFEPDIVQSTKARSLNRFGQLAPPIPVAPPRKKKGQSVGPAVSDTLVCSSSSR